MGCSGGGRPRDPIQGRQTGRSVRGPRRSRDSQSDTRTGRGLTVNDEGQTVRRHLLTGAVEVDDGVGDSDVEDADDKDRQEKRNHRVDAVGHREKRHEVGERTAQLVLSDRVDAGRPDPEVVEHGGKDGQTGDDHLGSALRAEDVTLQRKVNGQVTLNREADHIPDAEEAADVGDEREDLAQTVHSGERFRPEDENAEQEADVGDAQRCQVDARRYRLHVAADKDDEGYQIAGQTCRNDQRNGVAFKVGDRDAPD